MVTGVTAVTLETWPDGFEGMSAAELVEVFNELSDYFCVHQVELDEFGDVVDARLLAWNRAYRDVRTKPVERMQSMRETYFQSEFALDFVNQAWRHGTAKQVFELAPSTRDRYRPEGAVLSINVLWQRVGDLVVEVGTDLNEVRLRQMQLADEESAAAATARSRVAAEVRERIASDLHDSVIQQLFASALLLRTLAENTPDPSCRDAARQVSETISQVITEIRLGIMDVRGELPSSLEQELVDTVEPIATASGVRFRITVADDVDCDGEIRSNLRVAVRELVTNAVRHGHAAAVAVDVARDGYLLVVRVSDDGIGIPVGTQSTGGLSNLRRRAERLGGSMSFADGEGGGTVLTWQVPLPIGGE
jgi:hypothetical protein